MYCSHFGFSRQPFKITPDTSLFFSGGDRGATLEAVSYAIQSGSGITKVVGEVGTGKTMLCRMLEVKLPRHVDIVYIANPDITPENILNVIAFEMGLIKSPISKLEVMQLLQAHLLQRYSKGCQVVVLIEEAQAMPLETLEEIRLLSNLETGQDKLMQIVLFGQPELDTKLLRSSIRQLSERIVHSFYLGPLKKEQIRDYLNFRVHSAGYHAFGLFNDRTAALIASASKGLMRRVNILADKTLLAAYADGSHVIMKRHVQKAIKDTNFYNHKWYKKIFQAWGVATAITLTLMGVFEIR